MESYRHASCAPEQQRPPDRGNAAVARLAAATSKRRPFAAACRLRQSIRGHERRGSRSSAWQAPYTRKRTGSAERPLTETFGRPVEIGLDERRLGAGAAAGGELPCRRQGPGSEHAVRDHLCQHRFGPGSSTGRPSPFDDRPSGANIWSVARRAGLSRISPPNPGQPFTCAASTPICSRPTPTYWSRARSSSTT